MEERVKPSSRFFVGCKLIFCRLKNGPRGNWWPDNLEKRNSPLICPKYSNIPGSTRGVVRVKRNIYMGSALSLSINGALCPGPSHRLCLPNVSAYCPSCTPAYISRG